MTDLFRLIDKYGSDKGLSGYTRMYHALFEPLRYEKLDILEIGIGSLDKSYKDNFAGNLKLYPNYKQGGSLRAWRDYFINSQITGIDIGEDCLFQEERLRTFVCDSTESQQINLIFGKEEFDLIIDDGCHIPEFQVKTLENFYSRVKKGGLYIIEDTGRDGLWIDPYISQISKIAESRQMIFGNIARNMMIIIK